jgi:tetratricopeptide (TPR) repeat protein
MILLALVLLVANPSQRIAECLQQKDRVCLSSILRKPPLHQSPEYLAVAARAYILLNRPKEALEAIDQALEQLPENFDYLMERGWIYQKLGDQTSAIHSFLVAAKIEPRNPATFYELGMSFFLIDEFQRAEPHFKRVLDLTPTDDRAIFMLGVLDIMANEESDAKVRFEKALELQPKNAHYLLHYGVLLNQLGETDQGLEYMLRAKALDPANPLTHYNLGRTYLSQGKMIPARDELETAIRLRSNLTPAFYKLNTIYRALGDRDKANAMLKRYQELQQQETKAEEDPTDNSLLKP